MQLASILPLSSLVAASTSIALMARPPRPAHRSVRMPEPSSPRAPAASEGAIDGVARMAAAPIFDFPGIAAGDVFDIVKGSKAGSIGVRGEALVKRLDPDHATFHVMAGRFGVKVDVVVDIKQVDANQVLITTRGVGLPDMTELGRIVEQRTDHAVFEQVSDPSRLTTMSRDDTGRIVIDTVIPKFGTTHLELQPRD